MSTGERADLKPLTSMRFVAALMVFVYHYPSTFPFAATYAFGYSGVGFFFLLSGFILTYTYYHDFSGPLRWSLLRRFYVARFARIYPVHMVTLLLAVAVLWKVGGDFWTPASGATRTFGIAAAALLAQTWFPIEQIFMGGNSPAWSISVEAFFYALFPFLIRSLLRSFAKTSPAIIYAAATLPWLIQGTIYIAARLAVFGTWLFYVFPPLRLLDFVTGCLLGIAFMRGRNTSGMRYATAFEAAVIGSSIAAIVASRWIPISFQYSLFMMPFWSAVISVLAIQRGFASRILAHPTFVRLGEVSFSFYLIHLTVIRIISGALDLGSARYSFMLTLIISLAAAFALFHWIETPMRDWIRGPSSKQRQSSAPC